MEKQRNMDEQNWKAQMDAVHDVLDTKVNEKPFEDLKHCVASLTKGVGKCTGGWLGGGVPSRNLTAAVWGRPPPSHCSPGAAAAGAPPLRPPPPGRVYPPLCSCCYRGGGSQYLPDLRGFEDLQDLGDLE